MALRPSDFDIPGLGRWFGESMTLEQDVAEQAQFGGKDSALAHETLVAAGWKRHYTSLLEAPVLYGAEEPVLAMTIRSYVREFDDAAGAAVAFNFLEDESFASSPTSGVTPVAGEMSLAEDIPGTRVIGDDSEITRHLGVGSFTNLPFNSLDLTFRVGNLVAGVSLSDFTGGEPEVAEVEAMAQIYLERITQVQAEGGPGLSTRIVRLDAPDITASRDDYAVLDGVIAPDYNQTAESAAEKLARYGAASDVAFVIQRFPSGGEGSGDDVYYRSDIYRFADDAAATDWLTRSEERLANLSGVVSFTPVPDAATLGDESQSFAIERVSSEQETRGYLIYARVGNEVAETRLFAQPEAPLAVAEELAQAQVACLESAEICERIAAPAALVALAVLATPVAGTPVS
jgi:hypothetical protein